MSASAGVLVGPVALDAREAQRDAARVARRGLHAVERDLDDELGPDEHRDARAARVSRASSSAVCQREQLVGQALEGLADHHEPAGAGIARAEVEVREPALPPAVAPLGAEHDEVVRAHRLDLPPRLAAAAGRVQRRGVLDDDALVPGRERLVEHALAPRRGPT